jgi:DedD protein
MEKRKLLLVAVSVGVFLVIVLSAAILIFTPSPGGAAAARLIPEAQPVPAGEIPGPGGNRGPASADAVDMVRNAGELQDLSVPPPGAVSPASASAIQENNFYINNGQASAPSPEEPDSSTVVINVPKPSAPGVPAPAPRAPAETRSPSPAPARQNPANPANQPAREAAPASSGGAASGRQEAASGQAPAAPPPAPRAPAAPPASPPPPARVTTAANSAARAQRDYWIQTGAFSALVRAEDAKETLASKGLASIIDDGEVNGQTWYRVRVGPYTTENEASYWLALVRAINGFDQSQIRSTQR